MFLYTTIEAIVAVVAGILIAVRTKKADDVTYSKLDKIGRVTNMILLLFYVGFSFSIYFSVQLPHHAMMDFLESWDGSYPLSWLPILASGMKNL